MLRAIYPGSFDPVTYGHMDMILRSSKLVDELIIGVLNNKAKSPLFSVEERVRMLEEVTSDIPNVRILPFGGFCPQGGCMYDYPRTEGDYGF